METLQINNKHYQECDVVMLQTDKAENCLYASYNNILNYYSGYLTQDYLKNVLLAKAYHLYILSDEKIKGGDWFFNGEHILQCSDVTDIIIDTEGTWSTIEDCRKIIATTDSSLNTGFAKSLCPKCNSKMKVHIPDHLECTNCGQKGWNLVSGVYNEVCKLPQIPQSFIEHFISEYNKGNVISKVLVEVEDDYSSVPENEEDIILPWRAYVTSKIKVNQSNEISILTEQKKVFSREEVITLLFKFLNRPVVIPDRGIQMSLEDWIQKNLK